MSVPSTSWPPIAVVALGDPEHSDDGLPLRVMGRVRTLIGEIGMSRATTTAARTRGESGSPRGPSGAEGHGQEHALQLAVPQLPHGPLVQWIEGGTESDRLEPFLERRQRVVILDTIEMGGKVGSVCHWHLGQPEAGGISLLRHYGNPPPDDLFHLAFWLEDDLPPGGFDLIAVEPGDRTSGTVLSSPIRQRFATICSQVTALVFRILVEEGW